VRARRAGLAGVDGVAAHLRPLGREVPHHAQASWATGAIPSPAPVVVCCDVACNILGGIYWAMSGFTPKPALAAAAG
jgi:hypothetical protein